MRYKTVLLFLLIVVSIGNVQSNQTEYIIDDWDNISVFLANDSTDATEYGRKSYNCMDFSTDLASNLIADDWDAGVVLKSGRNRAGHALVWVVVQEPYEMFYIEPQLDEFYNPVVYRSGSEETHIFREVSVETAIRCHNDAKSWW